MQFRSRTPGRHWRTLAVGTAVGALTVMSTGVVLASHGFPDVPTDHAFHDEISWLADTGITTGYPDGSFQPDTDVTRQAMAAFMQRLAGHDDDVDPMVRAEHALEADSAGRADEADHADEADYAEEAGDAQTLDGKSADAFVTDTGFTHTAVGPHTFHTSQSAATVAYGAGVARFTHSGGILNMYAQPDVDTTRFGETQYLHTAEVCIGDSSRPVSGAALRVWRQPADRAAEMVFAHEIAIGSGEAGCHRISVDLDQDGSIATAEGFELAATDFVELRVFSQASGERVELRGGTVTTSASPTRSTGIIVIPPIIIDPPIIINPLGATDLE